MKEEEKDNGIKISMPLITNLELQEIDNNMDNIVEQFTKAYIHDKELAIAQHIIEIQKAEIEKKDRIINLMARVIVNLDDQLVINHYKDKEQCIEYFTKLAEEEK